MRETSRAVDKKLQVNNDQDTSVYDAMVILAQDFTERYPIMKGHGNFGSIDGDNAAAMRYTEIKLSRYGLAMLNNINKDTIKWKLNYSGTEKEPCYAPTMIPNLLANGTSGIAEGMASNIPPHNLNELYDALFKLIDDTKEEKETSLDDILEYVKGPDFPLGASIINKHDFKKIYSTGVGRFIIRSNYKYDEDKNTITFVDIPYKANKAKILVDILNLCKEKKIEGIKDLRDESTKGNIAIVVELKDNANYQIVLQNLFVRTNLQKNYSLNMNTLVNGEPKVLDLLSVLNKFLEHAGEILLNKVRYEYNISAKRLNIVNGILYIKSISDKMFEIISNVKDMEEFKSTLLKLDLNEEQVEAITNMKITSLLNSSIDKYKKEKEDLEIKTEHQGLIMSDQNVFLDTLKQEFKEIKDKLGDDRRTKIISLNEDFGLEDLIEEKNIIITFSTDSCIKVVDENTYKSQNRGGKGVKTSSKEEITKDIITTSNKTLLLFFSSKGKCYLKYGYEFPESSRQSKSKSINNYLKLDEDENIVKIIPLEDKDNKSLLFITKKGTVKRLDMDILNFNRSNIKVINFKENDSLINVIKVQEDDEFVIVTKNGLILRTDLSKIRSMGKAASGVRGIRLRDNDEVVDATLVDDEASLLTVTKLGFAKQSLFSNIKKINRGGKGVTGHKLSDKTGQLINAFAVHDNDEIIIAISSGKMIRIKANSISTVGRTAAGVKIAKLENDEFISAVSIIKGDTNEEEKIISEEEKA